MANKFIAFQDFLVRDFTAGPGRIDGVVDRLGVVGAYQVFLHLRSTGNVVKRTVSAADGSYAFTGLTVLDEGFFTVALDHSGDPLNAAIADRLTPTV